MTAELALAALRGSSTSQSVIPVAPGEDASLARGTVHVVPWAMISIKWISTA